MNSSVKRKGSPGREAMVVEPRITRGLHSGQSAFASTVARYIEYARKLRRQDTYESSVQILKMKLRLDRRCPS